MSEPYSLEERTIPPWFQGYVLLAFRIDKALRACAAQSPFVNYYYGPTAWKALIDEADYSVGTRPSGTFSVTQSEHFAVKTLKTYRRNYQQKQLLADAAILCR